MNELEAYRQAIDALDREISNLFLKRMEITSAVGEYKQKNALPVLDAQREKAVIAAKAALTEDPLQRADLAALYEAIMGISRRQQRRLVRESNKDPGYAACKTAMERARSPLERPRVAYQGEPGCYSEEAAAGLFGAGVDLVGLP